MPATNGHHPTIISTADNIAPQDTEAEKCLLGSLIINNDAISQVTAFLRPEHFYRKLHGDIYTAILKLYHRSDPVDLLTLSSELPEEDVIYDLSDYVAAVPTSLNAEIYGRIVERAAIRRGMIRAASKIAKMGYDVTGDLDEQLALSDSELLQLRTGRTTDVPPRPREYAANWLDYIEMMRNKGEKLIGIGSPWIDVNRLLAGFIPGKLYYVGARPAMGKSSFLINLAAHWTLDLGKRVLLWSGEMDINQIVNRIAAERTRIPLANIRAGDLTDQQHAETTLFGGMIGDSGLIIDETAGITPAQLRATSNREYMVGGLDAVLVDYIGLMTPDRFLGNQNQELTEISRTLVSIARSLKVPVIAASQLSRDVEKRSDKRPNLSDLRDSGSLEQDAFAVIFLYRDDYYNPLSDRPSISEAIVAKHREGPTGTADLYWNGQLTTFRNLQRQEITF